MKIGIIGAGAVGSACLLSVVMRASAREVVLVNRNRKKAQGVVTDIQYGATLFPPIDVREGDHSNLAVWSSADLAYVLPIRIWGNAVRIRRWKNRILNSSDDGARAFAWERLRDPVPDDCVYDSFLPAGEDHCR
jgi:glutamyl-tRNA reductase